MSNETYEGVLKYDIYHAIELESEDIKLGLSNFTSESHADIPYNPLLIDEQWMNENVEYLFLYDKFTHQRSQGPEEYYMLFKTLIEKYNIEEDYNKFLDEPRTFGFEYKWKKFSCNSILCLRF